MVKKKAQGLQINLPSSVGDTEATVKGRKIVFISLEPDEDCSDPTDDDGFGKFFSFSRKHINFLDPSGEEAEEYFKDPDVVKLSYYEHGACRWFVDAVHKGVIPDRQWDSVSFAGIWVPDESVRESCPHPVDDPQRFEWMMKEAEQACETYSNWCNGWCCGYKVEGFKLLRDDDKEPLEERDDYEDQDIAFDESCWGFYETESALSDAEYDARRFLSPPKAKRTGPGQ